MPNKMLIDATHPEETRVVVLRGNRVEEFDFESAQRKQLRGNIYLAKVTRVEPSLQAAFVDYGGNRHGFLAFSEIHPDYYQIPVADRQALIDEEERAQRAADDEVDRRSRRHRHRGRSAGRRGNVVRSGPTDMPSGEAGSTEQSAAHDGADGHTAEAEPHSDGLEAALDFEAAENAAEAEHEAEQPAYDSEHEEEVDELAQAAAETPATDADSTRGDTEQSGDEAGGDNADYSEGEHTEDTEQAAEDAEEVAAENTEGPLPPGSQENGDHGEEEEVIESVGGADALEEVPDRTPRYRRQYKIQEVIKRRQVMLVQVVKEERGTKGAALTTYLSLAGRYSVLMPNTARGGGISRKITSSEDRARLKEAAAELEVPEGMGVILRTAGASRTKIEIKRDFEYLLRMWETVRDLTLKSTAPKLVYEEGSLVKRSIRDLYTKDIDEVIVAGSDGYHEAKDFMRMLMPSHAKNVRLYSDTQPLLSRYGVENQLDAMFSPVVQLRSGGYIVLNQAEALVAIDVNSGRATREHHIEDTALKTNLEASDEISRQLRLRDLAGLIVIDFIDMDEKRNNRAVERRLKECLKHDRARIQVGRISHFGLLEMSRQRIRTSVLESSTEKCPYCGGSGHVRSVSSLALQVLRALEEMLIKGATHNLIARTRPDVALYVLNQKRAHLRSLEERFAITITISADESVRPPQAFIIDRGEQVHTPEAAKAIAERAQAVMAPLEDEDDLEEGVVAEDDTGAEDEAAADAASEHGTSEFPASDHIAGEHQDEDAPRRRRRRRRRGGRNGGGDSQQQHGPSHERIPINEPINEEADEFAAEAEHRTQDEGEPAGEPGDYSAREQNEGGGPRRDSDRRRRRGRRGGRRNRHRNGDRPESHDQGHDASQDGFEAAQEISTPPSTEPELSHAVADLDSALPPPPRPAGGEAPAEPEPQRRRSTVRERAPASGGSEETAAPAPAYSPSPAQEPVVTDTDETADGDKPRRTGWWSRRFAGG